ncbi:SIR2 family protein [Yeosuana sp.]|uniref:SIR2 family protein n=1 Tax=Yeosuana sp. TaxID=2529388 RepID=UPI0040493CC6
MKFDNEIEIFINDFVKDLNAGTASIFAGAGLSVPAGYVNWKDLMAEIAQDLGLDINIETDLVSIAQFHLNENLTRSKLNRKILEEFTEDIEETQNHKILAKLPLSSIWTTNYDELIEKTFEKENKVVDVKHTNSQLLTTKPKRDIVIYKMHGDVKHPNSAILTKEQYEQYHQTHEPFINALSGELTTKTFLFIGFSFTDPNLDYVLSRLNFRFREEKRQHYCFVKKPLLGDYQNPDQATLDYNLKKQSLVINDLKRYGIKSLKIDSYDEITQILSEIDLRYKKRTIFISGSAETYLPFDRNEAIGFVHKLSKKLIEIDYKIVNGFGWGIGSSVINGALEAIYSNPSKYTENQLVLKPFPQFESGNKKLPELWQEYREKMISQCGITIFVFGNKKVNDEIVDADGIMKEFLISSQQGNICLPIGITNYMTRKIYELIKKEPNKYYENPEIVLPVLEQLADSSKTLNGSIKIITEFLKTLKK